MSKLIMQSEADYLNHFADFIMRWTEETVETTMGKPLRDSWKSKGGFRVTTLGKSLIQKVPADFNSASEIVNYIESQNSSSQFPTAEQIAINLFSGDLAKALGMLNGLVIGCAVQFLQEG